MSKAKLMPMQTQGVKKFHFFAFDFALALAFLTYRLVKMLAFALLA